MPPLLLLRHTVSAGQRPPGTLGGGGHSAARAVDLDAQRGVVVGRATLPHLGFLGRTHDGEPLAAQLASGGNVLGVGDALMLCPDPLVVGHHPVLAADLNPGQVGKHLDPPADRRRRRNDWSNHNCKPA
jgi:hypothetical protein